VFILIYPPAGLGIVGVRRVIEHPIVGIIVVLARGSFVARFGGWTLKGFDNDKKNHCNYGYTQASQQAKRIDAD
jgi:hypothetical protein